MYAKTLTLAGMDKFLLILMAMLAHYTLHQILIGVETTTQGDSNQIKCAALVEVEVPAYTPQALQWEKLTLLVL